MQRDIRGEILAASFWENWNYAKELARMKHPKRTEQFKEAEKIRSEWIDHQKAQKKTNG